MRGLNSAFLLAAIAAATFGTEASAQTATATATYEVKAINEVSVSGNPVALVIDAASELTSGVTDNTTTWAVTTNQTGAKVTGALNLAMPTGVTLKVNLAAPTGGTSAGTKTLDATGVDLVTGITKVQGSALAVTYTLTATAAAGVQASATRTLTLTISGGA